MGGLLLLALGVVFLFSSAFYLSLNKNARGILLGRLSARRGRSSITGTPPRSLSPSKKETGDFLDYPSTFPPSQRHVLAQIQSNGHAALSKPRENVALDQNIFEAERTVYTPTEFSSEEVKALGDFPDYATLSGVPLPKPYTGFDIKTARPRPYRPLRWAYHQTMSYKKMETDWWLELQSNYAETIRQRQEIFAKVGHRVLNGLPGSELACKELMEMCLQFICARYPQYFRLDLEKMVLYNGILKTETHIKKEHPLRVILDNIPEDFGIMLRDPTNGYYFLRAGLICSSLGWDLGSKMGMRLDEIHQPIPDYKEKMQKSMDRYFAKKAVDKPIQRGSWGLEVDEPLYMPPGDPHEKYREFQEAGLELNRLNLRVDWQTLRRLPLSGAVIFNFKALFTPIETFRDEPYIPALLLKILREGKKSLMDYKSTWHTEHVVIPAMEKFKREQIEKGLVPEDWEEGTLSEYPYFPGWEEKWHREQGF
ncbi:hypothetical protein K490DRAFT_74428 [Saccharata proteae CBS 121410]|uniref:HRQ family protein n=1 Tax=Saccharata proteae CBS 121410 TaxID=1314787 RepID=A0A9P4HTZ1_9PEZI|nr:hypothetical protein K490DRAFT_74428 [Saccharata proteae CBS 121410]